MRLKSHDIAVCSWSLMLSQANDLAQAVRQLGLAHVHLGVAPLLDMNQSARRDYAATLRDAGITITCTMIAFPGEDYSTIDSIRATGGFDPDELWSQRRQMTLDAARLTRDLGVASLSTHIGFVPPPEDSARFDIFLHRCREVADALAADGITLVLETGQEPADRLVKFLADVARPNLKVNFDPANMILYGAGDPVAAVRAIARRIGHVHIKDAAPSTRPGVEWGADVPVGEGVVPWPEFLAALDAIGYRGALAIEREAGNDRAADVARAIRLLQTTLSA